MLSEVYNMLEAIKELRARTHLGMTTCKKALEVCSGDIDQAIEYLQKQGTIKRAEEVVEAKEGMVFCKSDGSIGLIAEVNCQTDFAARSEVFRKAVDHQVTACFCEPDYTLLSKQLGETVSLKRNDVLQQEAESLIRDGFTYPVRSYNHHSGKIAVLLLARVQQETPEVLEFLDECAMQIAANNPLGLNREDVAGEETKQRAIFAEQVPPKAEKMKEKIIQGKMEKWFSDVILSDQESIVHSGKTISQLKADLEVKFGGINLISFIRYELGQ